MVRDSFLVVLCRQETCPCCRKPVNPSLIFVMFKLSKSIGRLKIKVGKGIWTHFYMIFYEPEQSGYICICLMLPGIFMCEPLHGTYLFVTVFIKLLIIRTSSRQILWAQDDLFEMEESKKYNSKLTFLLDKWLKWLGCASELFCFQSSMAWISFYLNSCRPIYNTFITRHFINYMIFSVCLTVQEWDPRLCRDLSPLRAVLPQHELFVWANPLPLPGLQGTAPPQGPRDPCAPLWALAPALPHGLWDDTLPPNPGSTQLLQAVEAGVRS